MWASPQTSDRARRFCFAIGLGIMLWLASRAQTGGDQLNLLSRGWLWAARGVFLPYGNPLSNGGNEPGPLTTLLVGAPLFAWRNARAPIVLILAFHVAAYLLLERTLRSILRPGERLLFAIVYWLNPWRLYFSGFLWNPNYLFLPAAIHLSTAWASRERARFGASFLHVVALGAAFQLHPSFLILGIASLLLIWRRAARVHWPGALAGGALVLVSLAPWIRLLAAGDSSLVPGGRGFLFRGLIFVFPLLRGWLYWLRYGALYLPHDVLRLDFVDLLGERAGALLARPLDRVLAAVTPLTVALPLWSNARFLRRWRTGWQRPATARGWLRSYVFLTLVAATATFAMAPTTVMPWQALIAFHAAVLPLVFLGGALARTPRWRSATRRGALAWAATSLVLTVILGAGSRYYRCHGPLSMGVGEVLRHDHPMFHDLGWSAQCPPSFDAEHGWWPDALPEN